MRASRAAVAAATRRRVERGQVGRRDAVGGGLGQSQALTGLDGLAFVLLDDDGETLGLGGLARRGRPRRFVGEPGFAEARGEELARLGEVR